MFITISPNRRPCILPWSILLSFYFLCHQLQSGASLPSARGRHCEPCRKEIPPWFFYSFTSTEPQGYGMVSNTPERVSLVGTVSRGSVAYYRDCHIIPAANPFVSNWLLAKHRKWSVVHKQRRWRENLQETMAFTTICTRFLAFPMVSIIKFPIHGIVFVQGAASPKPLDATSVPINSCPPRYSSAASTDRSSHVGLDYICKW